MGSGEDEINIINKTASERDFNRERRPNGAYRNTSDFRVRLKLASCKFSNCCTKNRGCVWTKLRAQHGTIATARNPPKLKANIL